MAAGRDPHSLSILIPTIGRSELARLLSELVPQLLSCDEILVIGDGPQPLARAMADVDPRVRYLEHGPDHCWGHPQRNWAMPLARGAYLMSFDDDDRVAPRALERVRGAMADHPGRPLMFREYHEGSVIWSTRSVALGNVSTQMIVVPNVPERLGKWGSRYEGDYDFIQSTLALYAAGVDALVWRPEVIALHGTASWKGSVDTWVWTGDDSIDAMIARMEGIPGWFSAREAALLFETAKGALASGSSGNLVEIGSYCGRSTLVLGSAAQSSTPRGRVFAIDPHDGMVSSPGGSWHVEPSLERFTENMRAADLVETVTLIKQRSSDVDWDLPIALLFIDGLHDYASVSGDFTRFEPHVEPRGLIAFHDYSNGDYPDVRRLVDEALASSRFETFAEVETLKVLLKTA